MNIFSWGNNYNRLYFRREEKEKDISYTRPHKLDMDQNVRIVKIFANSRQNVAIDSDGYLYSWGENKYCCLGHDNSVDLYHPRLVRHLQKYYV